MSAGTVADCSLAVELIDGLSCDFLLADRGYDTDAVVGAAEAAGAEAVIPPRRSRKARRPYDEHLYRQRHLVENAFMRLKRWRGVATRYAKKLSSFEAAVQIRCMALWLSIL